MAYFCCLYFYNISNNLRKIDFKIGIKKMFLLKNVCFRDTGKTFTKFQRHFQKMLPKKVITNTQYLKLICVGGVMLPPPSWSSLNNSKKIKAVTVAFWSIYYHLIRDIRAKFGIPNLSQSQDTAQNSDLGI